MFLLMVKEIRYPYEYIVPGTFIFDGPAYTNAVIVGTPIKKYSEKGEGKLAFVVSTQPFLFNFSKSFYESLVRNGMAYIHIPFSHYPQLKPIQLKRLSPVFHTFDRQEEFEEMALSYLKRAYKNTLEGADFRDATFRNGGLIIPIHEFLNEQDLKLSNLNADIAEVIERFKQSVH